MIAECQRSNAEPRRQRDTALARRRSDDADRLTARFATGDPAAAALGGFRPFRSDELTARPIAAVRGATIDSAGPSHPPRPGLLTTSTRPKRQCESFENRAAVIIVKQSTIFCMEWANGAALSLHVHTTARLASVGRVSEYYHLLRLANWNLFATQILSLKWNKR